MWPENILWTDKAHFTLEGAVHTQNCQRLLREIFTDERIISRNFPSPWPARSPDLNPCDFWLWGYLKDRVYQGHFRSLVDLRTSKKQDFAQIPRELLRATIDHAILRCSMKSKPLVHILKAFCNELIIKLISHFIICFTVHFLIRARPYLCNILLKQCQIFAWLRKL